MNPHATEVREVTTQMELREVQAVGRPYQYLEGQAVPYDTWADLGWFLESHRAGSFKRSTNGRVVCCRRLQGYSRIRVDTWRRPRM